MERALDRCAGKSWGCHGEWQALPASGNAEALRLGEPARLVAHGVPERQRLLGFQMLSVRVRGQSPSRHCSDGASDCGKGNSDPARSGVVIRLVIQALESV